MTASDVKIGLARPDDLQALFDLYQHLNSNDPRLETQDIADHWKSILANPMIRYVMARSDDGLVSTCALTLVPNLTRGASPYGLIENVVTHPDWRGRGIGTSVLRFAQDIAWAAGCYKVMLLCGSSNESTLRFYEQAGFTRGEKTGFIARPK